jgi:D-erythronate 2-dehydrogenase
MMNEFSSVAGRARNFDAARARSLGLAAATSFDEIIRLHIKDEPGDRLSH